MENNLKYIVYCTTCTISKKIYIGVHQTTNPDVFDGYIGCGVYINKPCSYERSKTKFQKAVKKYGVKNFIRNTIAVFDNEDCAYELEEYLVDENFLKRPDVYNIALGGLGNNWNLTSKPVYKYSSKNGELISEYRSINEASLCNNVSRRSIYRVLQNKYKCLGFYWSETKFDKLDLSLMHQYEDPRLIPIFQYSNTGEYDCCYDSIRDASRVLGIHSANISNAVRLGIICNGKYFTKTYAPNFSISKNIEINSREIHQYDLEGNYINSYSHMGAAKKALGIKSDIYKAIKLGRLVANYQWSFEKLEKMPKIQPKSGRKRKIGKYDKNWNLIETYDTLQKCKEINGSGMIHVLSGRDEFAKGFRYKYLS